MTKRAAKSPPRSLAELRALAQKIADGQADITLGRSAVAALMKMLQSPELAATETIHQIARSAGVDPATLSRLGQKLGFEGFSGLQRVFKQHVSKNASFYTERVEEILEHHGWKAGGSLPRGLAEAECRRVLAAAEEINARSLARAAEMVVKAGRVHLLGLRGAYAVSFFLGSHLTLLRSEVSIIGGPGLTLASDLAQMKKGDLLIIAAYRPYTKLAVAACRAARRMGIQILSLTDTGSPIALKGSDGETLAISGHYFYTSALSSFFIAQLLLLAVATRLGKDAMTAAEDRSVLLDELDMEME